MFVKTNPGNRYIQRKTNRKPKDFWGPNMCCRRSTKQMYCKCPTIVEGIHPIIDGEYIWYLLDPEIGFKSDTDGNRLIDDMGNTLRGSGSYDGHMYSGVSLTLSAGGSISVPVQSEFDNVVYFDGVTKTFEQIANTNNDNFIKLEDGIFGPIVKLTKRSFTQYDLDIFTQNPVDILRWKFHEDVGISIPPLYEHEVYACLEGRSSYIYEVYYNQDHTRYLIINGSHTWRNKEPFGIQTLRLKTQFASIPYDNIMDNGEQITNNGEEVVDYY